MAIHVQPENGPARIAIEGEFTIYTVADWKSKLFDKLAAFRALDLDLSGVSEIDTAGQQLLIAAKIRAMALGTTLRVVAHSPVVVEVLDLCRLGSFFGDLVLMAESA
jgi:anti-sigma B factor antagonist